MFFSQRNQVNFLRVMRYPMRNFLLWNRSTGGHLRMIPRVDQKGFCGVKSNLWEGNDMICKKSDMKRKYGRLQLC